MTSERKRRANRLNARKCTGPHTAAGKARAARNALRHGLTRPAEFDPRLLRAIGELARVIAGEGANPDRRGRAARIAAAQVEVTRVRQAKRDLYSENLDCGKLASQLEKLDRYERRALARRGLAMREFDRAPDQFEGQLNSLLGDFGKTKPTFIAHQEEAQHVLDQSAGAADQPAG